MMDTRLMSVLSPATPAEAQSPLTLDLTKLTRLDHQLHALLPQLTQLGDTELLQLALHARQLETCAFRLRGACVAELRRRITTRFSGGRGKRDTDGTGIHAQLAQLAAEIGVSLATLKTDARIHEVFFCGETRLACEPSLAREYYVIALSAPDPLAAIQTAQERAADPAYNRQQFRRDLRQLQHAARPSTPASTVTPPARFSLADLQLSAPAQFALRQLIRLTGLAPDALISAALIAHYQAIAHAHSHSHLHTQSAHSPVTANSPPTTDSPPPANSSPPLQPSFL
jgi:hypothetical protein